MPFEIPIAFCIFNRPQLTAQVFQAIRAIRPRRLLIIGDGPRADHPTDPERVRLTRSVVEQVDWNCDVETCYADQNLGCRLRMSSGLDWAFARSESLIILEDDCLPHASFFPYCRALLDRYADDRRIGMISGDNFQPGPVSDDSYYFSKWAHIWGWASWRRAWQSFDLNLSLWPSCQQQGWLKTWSDFPEEVDYWTRIFDQVHRGSIDTWDFSWMFNCWSQNALTILPQVNLVSNLGFGPEATHTKDPFSTLSGRAVGEATWDRSPAHCVRHRPADEFTFRTIFAPALPPLNETRRRGWLRRRGPRVA